MEQKKDFSLINCISTAMIAYFLTIPFNLMLPMFLLKITIIFSSVPLLVFVDVCPFELENLNITTIHAITNTILIQNNILYFNFLLFIHLF